MNSNMEGKKLYIVDIDNFYVGEYENDERSVDEFTDEEIIKFSNGWCFDSWDEFIEHFNRDDYDAPTPTQHYMRLI